MTMQSGISTAATATAMDASKPPVALKTTRVMGRLRRSLVRASTPLAQARHCAPPDVDGRNWLPFQSTRTGPTLPTSGDDTAPPTHVFTEVLTRRPGGRRIRVSLTYALILPCCLRGQFSAPIRPHHVTAETLMTAEVCAPAPRPHRRETHCLKS